MLRVALCDDNRDLIEKYAQRLIRVAEKNQIETELSCFDSGESLLFHYTDTPEDVDIIYLDISSNRRVCGHFICEGDFKSLRLSL